MLECKQIDALMLDRLYGELPESSSSRRSFDQHVEDCVRCRAELASLERTREAIRELPEEEPPPALSAILLHEAARRAPGSPRAAVADDEGGRGPWAWLLKVLRPLAAHPAATAVATLVLVAGVAGSLYVRGKHQVAEPQASSAAAPPPVHAAAAVEPEAEPEAESERAAALAVNGYLLGAEAADVGLLGAEDQDILDLTLLDTKEVPLREQRNEEAGERAADERKLRRPTSTRSAAPRPRAEPTGVVANVVSGTDPLIRKDADDALPPKTAAFEARVAQQPSSAGAPPPAEASPRGATRDASQPELVWAQSQHDQLAQAVKDEKCREAARIANDILDRNAAYYRANVAGSKDVQRCQWYVADEQRRRAGARARRAAPAPKKPADSAAETPAATSDAF
jgi:hypothetical protein